ncbi:cerebral dopamine neurotrophic factor-like [Gadus chalcogrammus]|uniref:cerebral dopamine neurotrophic factor-like n=1 Tax=Gadus chalcogrammus TaxID=1042646 RepID=UPI0024C3114C|nr:cerebral dopamine neurotrophic factor-like [Gadus chalcogrammus]
MARPMDKMDRTTFLYNVPPSLIEHWCKIIDSGDDQFGWRGLAARIVPSWLEVRRAERLEAAILFGRASLRHCYYLGASSDAATRVTASVARPLSVHVPVEKICQRLGSTDKQICELKYEQQLWDLSSAGLLSLRVAELKRVLSSWGEECRGCLEKHEFVDLIQEKARQHQHDQHEHHMDL